MAKRGRKRKPNARRRETTRAGRAGITDPGSRLLRQQRYLLTGDPDLPVDPLGVLLGRGRIDAVQYHAGRDLQELLETIRTGLYGNPGSVQGSWLAILAGGAIRGPASNIAGPALWALRNLARIQARISDPMVCVETMRTCSGEWTDCVTALALCRQLLAYQSRDLVRIKDGLETVARIWGKNRANGA
jgi:hypothetical protein